MARVGLPKVMKLYAAWRFWQSAWTYIAIALGGTATAIGAVVAANTTKGFLPTAVGIALSVAAPVLTFVMTTLKPQSKATAFEMAARELEKVWRAYELDESRDDRGWPRASSAP
jgi:peptidoglycan/LPS O-acetylase OafA/YrhL